MAVRILNTHLIAPAAIVATALAAGCVGAALQDGGTYEATLAGKPFKLKISSSAATRERGLGGVTDIPADGGMIFVFAAPGLQNFWMYDCVTDMDIVYLDGLGYVTAIYEMTKEPLRRPDESVQEYGARLKRYPSRMPAQYVIELRAGRAKELGLQVQQKIEIDREALKAALR